MKRLLWGLAALALLLVFAFCVLAVLLDSPRGLRMLADAAQRWSDGGIRVGETEGVLLGEMELRDVTYRDPDGTQVHIARVHLRWHPRELLAGRAHIERVDLEDLKLALPPSAPTQKPKAIRLPTRLPLDAVVDAASLRGFELDQAGGEPFKLDSAKISGRWIGDRLEIAGLETALPETGTLKLLADARLASDHISIERLQVEGPGEVEARGVFGVNDAKSDLQLAFKELRYPLVGEEPPQLGALRGSARFTGTLAQYRFELQAQGVARQQPLALAAHGSGGSAQAQFDAFEVRIGEGVAGGRIGAQGSVAWAPALRADLDLLIDQLDPSALAPDWKGQINGRAHTQTTLREGVPDIAFSAQIERSTLRGQPLALNARGRTDLRRAQLDQLLLKAGKGDVDARGSVAWEPLLAADLEAQLRQFDPSAFNAGWPGSLNGRVHAQTARAGEANDIVFEARLANSRLRGYPLVLDASGDLLGGTLTLKQLKLGSGATQLSAAGQATPPFALAGRFDSPDLGALYPDLGGKLAFDFKLQGPLEDPHLQTQGKGSGLRYRDTRIAALNWNADVQPSKPSQVRIDASDAQAGLKIPSLRLAAAGLAQWHRVDLSAHTERGDLSVALQGGYDREREEWGGQWQSIRFEPEGLAAWSLEKPVGLLLGARRFSLEPACFTAAQGANGSGGRSCFNLTRQVTQPGLHVAWTLEAIALAGFKPLLPRELEASGRLDGSGELRWVDDNVASAHADLRVSEGRFSAPDAPPLDLQPSTVTLEQEPGGRLHAVVAMHAAQGRIDADVAAAPGGASFAERPLSGSVRVAVPDLAFVRPYSRELLSVGGRVQGELQLAGSAGRPRLEGRVALSEGHAKLATPGIEVTDAAISLTGQGTGPLALDGSLKSGGGALRLNGALDPSLVPPRVDLALKGERFQAMATPDARIWVTPDLHLVRDENGARLDGSLTVPKAEITPKNLGDSGVAPSRDQVILIDGAPPPPVEASPLKVYATLRLLLGDEVRFSGYGLSTRIAGAATLVQEPQREARAQGELRLIDGAYKAYGQDLDIESGRLIFDGVSVSRPVVDILAARRPASDIKVGVHVRGTLDKPQLSLQSDPPMSREQQLSWLLLGRPLDQNSSSDRSLISSAALSLGLSGGDFLANRVGKRIGLDTVSVGAAPAGGSEVTADASTISGSQAAQNAGGAPAGSQAAQLTLGKYLTPKLFVSYGVSLFQPGQTFRLLYDLGRGFKVQAESGVANGGDLLYTYERGGKKSAKPTP